MPSPPSDTVEPALALVALAEHDGPLIVDLDETVYLRNSTEDFLDCARPALPALLLLRALDVLKPWQWTGGDASRDVWRVRLVRGLLPWIDGAWQRRVAELASRHGNRQVLEVLRQRADAPLIATLGFEPIVAPLLAALDLGHVPRVAVSAQGFDDRRRGKLAMVEQTLGSAALARALVLTDSREDAPLLARCGRPVLTRWPQAHYRRALSGVYLPGQYLTLVKRPGERYILRGVLQEDYALWLLSSVAGMTSPLAQSAGLLMLLLSFWCIYECGYVDNDRVGARFELAPKLSAGFHQQQAATPPLQPWLWALASGALGVWLARWPAPFAPLELLRWVAVLAGTLLWFRWYNRMDKDSRSWLFAGLQFARSAAFVAVIPVLPIGAAAIAAHTLARWVPYQVYRHLPGGWPEMQQPTMRLLFLLVLGALVGLSLGVGALWNWTALGVTGWCLYRARTELGQIVRAAHRIDLPRRTAEGAPEPPFTP